MSDTGGRDQEVGAESVAASVCEDFVFWRRVSKLAPLNRIKSQCEPEPQETSQPQLLAGPAAGDTHGFVVSWGNHDDKSWSDDTSGCTAGPIMHAELGKYFSRLIPIDGQGCPILTDMQHCDEDGAGLEAPGWQQPHTFCYEPNALLRHFYPVPPPAVPKASSEGEQGGRQDTGLRYTTDDATSTEKRKERGLSTD